MSFISRITTWATDQLLTSSNLNGEFNNIINTLNSAFTNITVNASGYVVGTTIQRKQATSTTAFSSSSGSYVVTNLTTTFTPLSNTSVLRIRAYGVLGNSNGGSPHASIFRGSTNLAGSGNFLQCNVPGNVATTNYETPCAMEIEDSPASTTSLTYAVYIFTSGGANSSFGDSNNLQVMTIEEIAQ